MAMEVATIMENKGNKEEENSKGSVTNKPESLFFREPDHKIVRMNEDPDAQDYWEARLTTESLSALKTGNVDHSQKSCYHHSGEGPIKANCPE